MLHDRCLLRLPHRGCIPECGCPLEEDRDPLGRAGGVPQPSASAGRLPSVGGTHR